MRLIFSALYFTVIVFSPSIHAESNAAPFCPTNKAGMKRMYLAQDKLNEIQQDLYALKLRTEAQQVDMLVNALVLEDSRNVLYFYNTIGQTLSANGLCKKEAKLGREVSEDVINMLEKNTQRFMSRDDGTRVDIFAPIINKAKDVLRDAVREIRALY
jgi:hypothetical protein